VTSYSCTTLDILAQIIPILDYTQQPTPSTSPPSLIPHFLASRSNKDADISTTARKLLDAHSWTHRPSHDKLCTDQARLPDQTRGITQPALTNQPASERAASHRLHNNRIIRHSPHASGTPTQPKAPLPTGRGKQIPGIRMDRTHAPTRIRSEGRQRPNPDPHTAPGGRGRAAIAASAPCGRPSYAIADEPQARSTGQIIARGLGWNYPCPQQQELLRATNQSGRN
jgi:hypothetical protein